jgi:hypothetical protein
MKRGMYTGIKWTARIALVGMLLAGVFLALSYRSITDCEDCRYWLGRKFGIIPNPSHGRFNYFAYFALGGPVLADPPTPLCCLIHPDETPDTVDAERARVGMPVKNKAYATAFQTDTIKGTNPLYDSIQNLLQKPTSQQKWQW